MRSQIASDLHHEFIAPGRLGSEPIGFADSVDVLVLAGDIHSHANARNLYRDCPVSAQYLLTVERILRKSEQIPAG
jgi:hypothetical protein